MFKLTLVIWLVLGTTLAGIAVLVVVSEPSLYNLGMKTIPLAAAVGFLIAWPLSYVISKRIN